MSTSYIGKGVKILREDGFLEFLNQFMTFLSQEAYRTLNNRKYMMKYGQSYASPSKIVYVNPNDIEYISVPNFRKSYEYSTAHILDGKWDVNESQRVILYNRSHEGSHNPELIQVENYIPYRSAITHFKLGVPWSQTRIYHLMDEDILHREKPSLTSMETMKDVDDWLEGFDELYENIRDEGYKSASTIQKDEDAWMDEVAINIGRDGRMVLEEGKHRFIISKILNLKRIPVRVFVRHKQWQELRDEIHNNGLPKGREDLRDHPDLQDILN